MLVSVIVPIYNISHYLRGCLDSCRTQTYKNIEIICVDDGATDGSGVIADEYTKTDSRFKVIHKQNGGLPSARKAGIEVAKGDYVFHLDGDDDIPENAISDLICIAKETNADIVIGQYYSFENNNKIHHDSRIKKQISGQEYLDFILKEGLFNIWGKLIKRDLYELNPIQIPESISMGEDLVQITQLAYYSRLCVPCDKPVYNYYVRETSMSKNDKSVIGSLTDRSIYAVDFVTRFLSPRAGQETRELLLKYVKGFIYEYMCSPYPVSMRRQELKTLANFVNGINSSIKSFRDIVCMLARHSLPVAKQVAKLSRLKR